MSNGSGEHVVQKSPFVEHAQKFVLAILLVVTIGTANKLWDHERRVVVLETARGLEAKSLSKDMKRLREDLAEIKADVKKLLEGPR